MRKPVILGGATLPETNIAPENWWLEDEVSFLDGPFSGVCSFQGGYCTGAVWMIEFHGAKKITTNRFLKFLPKTRNCFDSGLLISNKDVLHIYIYNYIYNIRVHKSTSRSWLKFCCSPVFLRETDVMIYNSLRYKYTYQKITSHTTRIFECLSNNVQLRYSQSIPINDDMNTIIFNYASLHREFHLGTVKVKAHKALSLDKCYVWGFLNRWKIVRVWKDPGLRWMSLLGGLKVMVMVN